MFSLYSLILLNFFGNAEFLEHPFASFFRESSIMKTILVGHWERPPFHDYGGVVSAYHVRSVDVFRLKQLRPRDSSDGKLFCSVLFVPSP